MTTRIRLLLYGTGLAVAFAVSWMLGSALAPAGAPAVPPPVTAGHPHESGH